MEVASTRAYYDTAKITAVKSFIAQAPSNSCMVYHSSTMADHSTTDSKIEGSNPASHRSTQVGKILYPCWPKDPRSSPYTKELLISDLQGWGCPSKSALS
jgi:hypothetical protein